MPKFNLEKLSQEDYDLLRLCASPNRTIALDTQHDIAKALELPLREGVMSGPITDGIFETIPFTPGVSVEWPLDLLQPGTEKDYVAYTVPNNGYIPLRNVESDYVRIATYNVGNAIDWSLRYARDARWDIVTRALEVMEAGVIKKINDDAFHVLLAAAVDRNIVVYDSDAAAGQFTKRLVSLGKNVMRRNGGGNSSSVNRRKMTDIIFSPEHLEDIRNWGVDQVDEVTRREIYTSDDGKINRIFGVNLHDFDEFGVGQEYQLYYTGVLGASNAASDEEISLGLDLSRSNSFVMPMVQPFEMFEDDSLHRHNRHGWYGRGEWGFGALDGRNIVLLSA